LLVIPWSAHQLPLSYATNSILTAKWACFNYLLLISCSITKCAFCQSCRPGRLKIVVMLVYENWRHDKKRETSKYRDSNEVELSTRHQRTNSAEAAEVFQSRCRMNPRRYSYYALYRHARGDRKIGRAEKDRQTRSKRTVKKSIWSFMMPFRHHSTEKSGGEVYGRPADAYRLGIANALSQVSQVGP